MPCSLLLAGKQALCGSNAVICAPQVDVDELIESVSLWIVRAVRAAHSGVGNQAMDGSVFLGGQVERSTDRFAISDVQWGYMRGALEQLCSLFKGRLTPTKQAYRGSGSI